MISLNSVKSVSEYLITGVVSCTTGEASSTDFVKSGSYFTADFVLIFGITTLAGLGGSFFTTGCTFCFIETKDLGSTPPFLATGFGASTFGAGAGAVAGLLTGFGVGLATAFGAGLDAGFGAGFLAATDFFTAGFFTAFAVGFVAGFAAFATGFFATGFFLGAGLLAFLGAGFFLVAIVLPFF